MPGNKSKLTKALISKACKLKAKGYTNTQICQACEISEESFYKWQRGEDVNPLSAELIEGLKKAEADKQAALLAKIEAHGEEHWQALCWYMERMWPERFGRVDRLQAEVRQETKAQVSCAYYMDYGEESAVE
jgi:hypothetical protein